MLVYAVKKYLPTRCGIMTLETPDHGYIYVDLKIFESALMLSSQAFYQTFESAETVVKPQDKPHRETVRRLYNFLPHPLKPLALLLYWTDKEYEALSDQIGCLHIISTIIHPYQWLKAPKDQRMELGPFGPSIRTEYTYEWKSFTEGCIDYETLVNPSESNDRHPIFVINAVPGSMPSVVSAPAAPAPAVLEGGYAVEIDFDEILPDEPEDGEEETEPAGDTDRGLRGGYQKLLE